MLSGKTQPYYFLIIPVIFPVHRSLKFSCLFPVMKKVLHSPKPFLKYFSKTQSNQERNALLATHPS